MVLFCVCAIHVQYFRGGTYIYNTSHIRVVTTYAFSVILPIITDLYQYYRLQQVLYQILPIFTNNKTKAGCHDRNLIPCMYVPDQFVLNKVQYDTRIVYHNMVHIPYHLLVVICFCLPLYHLLVVEIRVSTDTFNTFNGFVRTLK